MVQPALRNPVRAARMLCSCHPVAAIRSAMPVPSGRRIRASILAFLLVSGGAAVGAGSDAGAGAPEVALRGRGSRTAGAEPPFVLAAGRRGAVAEVVESAGGVVSGSLQRARPAFERRWRPRHGTE